MNIEITPEELRYIINCGPALVQNIPEKAVRTYCGFSKEEIIDFSLRMRKTLDEAGYDM